jgi:hypothetical protein
MQLLIQRKDFLPDAFQFVPKRRRLVREQPVLRGVLEVCSRNKKIIVCLYSGPSLQFPSGKGIRDQAHMGPTHAVSALIRLMLLTD